MIEVKGKKYTEADSATSRKINEALELVTQTSELKAKLDLLKKEIAEKIEKGTEAILNSAGALKLVQVSARSEWNEEALVTALGLKSVEELRAKYKERKGAGYVRLDLDELNAGEKAMMGLVKKAA